MTTAELWELFAEEDEEDPLADVPAAPFPGGGSPVVEGVPYRALLPTFPNARVVVEAAFGADLTAPPQLWSFYDITRSVRQAGGQRVNISPMGRGDEASQAQPAGCSFELNNASGDYSAYSPSSKWWPFVRANTPIRVTVNLTGDRLDGSLRFYGFANGWVPSWDTSAKVAVVTVSASGVLRRLGQGKGRARSALARAVLASAPIAYWTLDDGRDARAGVSSVAGVADMSVPPLTVPPIGGGVLAASPNEVLSFAAIPGPPGLPGPVVDLLSPRGGDWFTVLSGSPLPTATGTWVMDMWMRADAGNADATGAAGPRFEWFTTGSGRTRFYWFTDLVAGVPTLTLTAATADDLTFTNYAFTAPNIFDKSWHYARVVATVSGSDVALSIYLDAVLVQSATLTGSTPGGINQINIHGYSEPNRARPMTSLALASLAVYRDATTSVVTIYTAGLGHAGEIATARIARLCAEEGVPLTLIGTSTTRMGVQGADPILTLIRECEAVDHGTLYDGRGPGLGYVTRSARYNLSPALTVDMAAHPPQVAPPFSPVDDDQRTLNVVKADRKDGSSVTVEKADGPKGTGTVGVYDSTATLNVSTDDVLAQHGAWLVGVGTVEGFRYPRLNLDPAATPAIAAGWLAADVAERVDVTHVTSKATQHPPDDVALLLEGWAESIGPFDWDVAATCSPYRPYEVYQVEAAGNRGRLDSDNSILHFAIDAVETTIFIETPTTAGPFWRVGTPSGGSADILVTLAGTDAGERMTITSVAAESGTSQALTVTRSVNGVVRAWPAGSTVRLWKPGRWAL